MRKRSISSIQTLAFVFLTGFALGSGYVASRIGVLGYNPVVFAGLSLAIAAIGYMSIYMLRLRPWGDLRHIWKHAFVLGLFGTALPLLCIYYALQFQSSGITAVIVTANPAITIVMANFILPQENLTLQKGIGTALAFGGVLVLVVTKESGLPNARQAEPVAVLLTLVALFLISSTIIYNRKYATQFSAISITSAQTIVASLVVLPFLLVQDNMLSQEVGRNAQVALAYNAIVGTFLAFLLHFNNVRRFGATIAATADYVSPVIAGIGGVVILNEQITWPVLLSVVIIIVGIALIHYEMRGGTAQDSK